MAKDFFEKQTASSKIKANIVSEYFPKYCKIINTKGVQQEIRYIDLFAGPGKYKDENFSTPLLLARQCASNSILKDAVHLMFNDNEHIETLKHNFLIEFPDGTFKHTPKFANKTIGEDEKINTYLGKRWHDWKSKNPFPTLLFVDPFGYKGINTTVLANFMQNWGNEIFLFLNTKRIHAAIENDKFEELMLDFFPRTLTEIKKDRRYRTTVLERLNLIIHNLNKEYNTILGSQVFCTAFKFQEEDSEGTSHFIVHFTKHPRGFDLIKQIYCEFDNVGSALDEFGTYTFDAKMLDKSSSSLFDFGDANIDILSSDLLMKYKGKTISALDLYNEHQTNSKFARRHYADALRKLVENEHLETSFTDNKSHKKTVLIINECVLKFK